ncbi:hypothetical protein ACE6H2_019643 [Prunus campanulata]
MAPFKTILFVCVLIAAVSSVSKAQDLGLGGVISIQGTVYCTVNGTAGAAGPLLTPKFPNATVVLKCGATNTTDCFRDNHQMLTTPLVACNATLSPTTLALALQLVRTTVIDILSIVNVRVRGFHATA